ncbi:MAG: lipoprotein [Natronospirillum sp.]
MRQPVLLVFLLLVLFLAGCGFKTDLTLPEENARASVLSQESLFPS